MFGVITAFATVLFAQKLEEVANAVKAAGGSQYPLNTQIAVVEDVEQK